MRSSFFVLTAAALAGLAAAAAAQNSTDTSGVMTGPAEDLGQCLVACSERAVAEHSEAAQKCINTKSEQEQTACICQSDELLTALESCITSTCPDITGGLNLEQRCELFNSATSLRSVGMLRALVASAAIAAGALLV